ncbi:MAG TPA: HD domain-containing protein, partial [Tissierellaceae bacterium]
MVTLDSLVERIKSYNPSANLELVKRAYEFAKKAHDGQHRVSGELYIFHPLGVAMILADLELDTITIAAGLLHDVVEDTNYTL